MLQDGDSNCPNTDTDGLQMGMSFLNNALDVPLPASLRLRVERFRDLQQS